MGVVLFFPDGVLGAVARLYTRVRGGRMREAATVDARVAEAS
jgi:hypothetical protein